MAHHLPVGSIALLLIAASLQACMLPALPTANGSPPPAASLGTAPGAPPAAVATVGKPAPGPAAITGKVSAPAGIVAAGGMNMVAAGGMNMVAAGGMNMVAAGGMNMVAAGGGDLVRANTGARRRLLAVEEKPLAGAEVFLADAAGQPLAGRASVRTGVDGSFTIPDAPAGQAVVVAARAQDGKGRAAILQTIVKTGDQGASADVGSASTMVAASLLQDNPDALARFNAPSFRSAMDATARNLKPEDLPDFADRAAVVKRMNDLAARVAEIQTALADLRQDIAAIKATLEDLKAALADLRNRPIAPALTPAPGGSPGAVAPGPTAGCDGIFGFLDADADGGITLAEWTAGFRADGPGGPPPAEVFRLVDADANGKLDRAEFVPACESHQRDPGGSPGPGPGPGGAPGCDGQFTLFDRDRDGRISAAEWDEAQRMAPDGHGAPPEAFGFMDRDHDGGLAREEFVPGCEQANSGAR